jgi:hypothetical protein
LIYRDGKKKSGINGYYMNLPTKNDVGNVVKQTIQAEEKIDILEEKIWNLQESFALATEEQNKMLAEIIEFTTKHLHSE